MFDAHPNVAIPLECKFALDLYPRYGKTTQWTGKDIDSFYGDLQEQLMFDTWTIDHEKLKSDLDGCVGNTPYGRICRIVYLHYQSFFEKEDIQWIGDKNPGYTIYTRKLSKIFPGAKFIHILRDYRDNYLSLKNVHFEMPIPSLAAAKWKLFYHKFHRASLKDSGNYLLLRYEDLVKDPEGEMKKLCAFLDLPVREEVFHFDEKKEEVLQAYPPGFVERYHENLLNKVNASRVERWREKLTEREVRILDYSVGEAAGEAGYVRKSDSFGLQTALEAAPGICLAHFLAFLTKIVDRFPYG